MSKNGTYHRYNTIPGIRKLLCHIESIFIIKFITLVLLMAKLANAKYSPAAKTHFGGEPVFVRYSFFYD